MKARNIPVHGEPLDAIVEAPPSKSETHRILVAAALARGVSIVRRPLDAADTRATRDGLCALGLTVREEGGAWLVAGCAGSLPGGGELQLGESGTSARLLAALAALGRRPSRLDGAPRLRERPLAALLQALRELDARVEAVADRLPLRVGGSPLRGGEVSIDASQTSQGVSALMLIASALPGGLRIVPRGETVSRPYVELTVRVLREYGVAVERVPDGWRVPASSYGGRELEVGGDHSSASYLLAAAAVVGGRVRVQRLDPASAQADAGFAALLERTGCTVRRGASWIEAIGNGPLAPFDVDLRDAPDLGPTLGMLAMFASGASRLGGIAHLRHKESDRVAVLADNLRRFGCCAEEGTDQLVIDPRPAARPSSVRVRTAGDHRMAMAFAVAGLAVEGVELDDAGCVAKSNPGFWDQLAALRTGC